VLCGELVQPLINLLRDRLLESAYIRMDETPVQVLKEPGKTAQSASYLWVQQSGERDHPVVLYDYAPSRAGAVPVALLGSFNGYLQTDGYAGYHAVVAANGITPLYCWAHARAGIQPQQAATQSTRQSAPAVEGARLDPTALCH